MDNKIVVLVAVLSVYCLFPLVNGRVSVSPTGTLYLGPATQSGSVKFDGDFVIRGRSLTTELAALDQTLVQANQLNFFRLSALRWQQFTTTQAKGACAFQINGTTYLAVADSSTTSQTIWRWESSNQTFNFFQSLTCSGSGNNDFEFIRVTSPEQFFLVDAPINGQAQLWKWGGSSFGSPTNIGPTPVTTKEWKSLVSDAGWYFLAQATTGACSVFRWNLNSWSQFGSYSGINCNDWALFARPDKSPNHIQAVVTYSTGATAYLIDNVGNSFSQQNSISANVSVDKAVSFRDANGDNYMVFAATKNISNTIYAEVFKLDNTASNIISTSVSDFVVQNPTGLEYFTYNSEIYLFVANQKTAVPNVAPQLRKWNTFLKRFDLISTISMVSNNALNNFSWETFTDGTDSYAFLSRTGTSYLYRLTNNF